MVLGMLYTSSTRLKQQNTFALIDDIFLFRNVCSFRRRFILQSNKVTDLFLAE